MKKLNLVVPAIILFAISLASCNLSNGNSTSRDSNVNWSLFEDSKKDEFFNYCQKTGFKIKYTRHGSDKEYYGAIKGNVIWRDNGNMEQAYLLDEKEQKVYSYMLHDEVVIDGPLTYEASVFKEGAFNNSFNVLFRAKEISRHEGFVFDKKSTYLDRNVDVYKYEQTVETVVLSSTFYVEQEFGLTLFYQKTQSISGGPIETIEKHEVLSIITGDKVIPPTFPDK